MKHLKTMAIAITCAFVLNSAAQTTTTVTQGLRVPRLTTTDRNSLVTAKGLLIFNIDTKCLEYWNGSIWIALR